MRVLEATETEGKAFRRIGLFWIYMRGTISAAWTVESRPKNDASASWEQDGDTNASTDKQVKWEGVEELEYRINVGSGNAGPTADVYTAYELIWE